MKTLGQIAYERIPAKECPVDWNDLKQRVRDEWEGRAKAVAEEVARLVHSGQLVMLPDEVRHHFEDIAQEDWIRKQIEREVP